MKGGYIKVYVLEDKISLFKKVKTQKEDEKHKTKKDELDNLNVAISENTHEFDWCSHFDKFQLKLRELIMSKIPK